MNDEIIDEVRAIRDAHAAKFNYDLRAIYEDIKRGEADLIAAGVKVIAPPISPTSVSALRRNRFSRREA